MLAQILPLVKLEERASQCLWVEVVLRPGAQHGEQRTGCVLPAVSLPGLAPLRER